MACAPITPDQAKIQQGMMPADVDYFDHEGIRCYRSHVYGGAAISCISIEKKCN